MNLGLFTPVFQSLRLEELLVELRRYPSIHELELGTGCWPGPSQVDVHTLLASPETFMRKTWLSTPPRVIATE